MQLTGNTLKLDDKEYTEDELREALDDRVLRGNIPKELFTLSERVFEVMGGPYLYNTKHEKVENILFEMYQQGVAEARADERHRIADLVHQTDIVEPNKAEMLAEEILNSGTQDNE